MAGDGLRHEARIVWLRPLEALPRYVREVEYEIPRRVGISRGRHPGVVGYAELRPDAPAVLPGTFRRRVFTVAPWDPYAGGGCPCEGVDPRTVRPGVWGVQTPRAVGLGVSGEGKR
jgi:hypothetical protein